MSRRQRARGAGLIALILSTLAAGPALADVDDVVLLPTVTPAADGSGALERPLPEEYPRIASLARKLDWILGEAAQDLGLTLVVSERARIDPEELSEEALVGQAPDSWVVSPRLQLEGSSVRLRIVAVPPRSTVLLVRSRETTPREMEVSAMVMMRDLVVAGRGATEETAQLAPTALPDQRAIVRPARSEGRAVLALNGAALGAYVGLSLQRASGSEDDRLLYPLIALGTGVGLGATMVAASEWDVGVGDAWYLSAGVWWPAASGLLLADSYDIQPVEDRYVYGFVGASAGITLATVALSFKSMSQGGAALTHSGGAWGTLLGGLAQLYYEGETDVSPTRGMGYGAGIGVLASGVLATQLDVKPSRVLLIDLLGALGGLTGAAVASPWVFGEEVTEAENRVLLASIAGGSLVGAGIGFFITAPSVQQSESAARWAALPYAGVIAASPDSKGSPALGGGLRGVW